MRRDGLTRRPHLSPSYLLRDAPRERLFLLDTKEKLRDIRKKLDGRLLVGDGTISILLANRGIEQPYNKPYNRANLTHARTVQVVHEEYLRARARVIETNTFLANRLNLLVETKPLVGGTYLMPPA